MSAHAVHQAIHANTEATTAHVAAATGLSVRDIHRRLHTLRTRSKVRVVRREGRVVVYASRIPPQADDPGLTDELRAIVGNGPDLLRFAAATGYEPNTVRKAFRTDRLDAPTDGRCEFNRELAEAAAMHLVREHEAKAAQLRAWVERCAKARKGEP